MNINFKNKEILKIGFEIIEDYPLCDSCFGRLFSNILKKKINNKDKAKLFRNLLKMDNETEEKNCWLCSDLLSEIDHFSNLIISELKNYEYDSFLIGSKIDEDIIYREKELFEKINPEFGESIKSEINRKIGKKIEDRLKKIVEFKKPDIMAIIKQPSAVKPLIHPARDNIDITMSNNNLFNYELLFLIKLILDA